jgi:hypothetical protein
VYLVPGDRESVRTAPDLRLDEARHARSAGIRIVFLHGHREFIAGDEGRIMDITI